MQDTSISLSAPGSKPGWRNVSGAKTTEGAPGDGRHSLWFNDDPKLEELRLPSSAWPRLTSDWIVCWWQVRLYSLHYPEITFTIWYALLHLYLSPVTPPHTSTSHLSHHLTPLPLTSICHLSLFYVFSVVPWMTRTMLCVWFHLHCHDIILLLQPWTNLSFLNWFLPLTIKVIGQVIIKCLELKGILENLHSTRVASIHHLWDKICYFCK